MVSKTIGWGFKSLLSWMTEIQYHTHVWKNS